MKKSLVLLLLIVTLLSPAITYASWWNPFSWFKNKEVTPAIQKIETATSTLLILPDIEKKVANSPKQELKTNVLNLPDGSVVEVDSNGDILRYIKEAAKASAPQNDSYFNTQIDALSKRINLLEEQLKIKMDVVAIPTELPERIPSELSTPINIAPVPTPKVAISAYGHGKSCGFDEAGTFNWKLSEIPQTGTGGIFTYRGPNLEWALLQGIYSSQGSTNGISRPSGSQSIIQVRFDSLWCNVGVGGPSRLQPAFE